MRNYQKILMESSNNERGSIGQQASSIPRNLQNKICGMLCITHNIPFMFIFRLKYDIEGSKTT